MKKYKSNRYFVISILWLVLLVSVVILPQKVNLILDKSYMNKVQFLERTPTKLSSQIDVTIAKKLEIMHTAANLGHTGVNLFSTGNKNFLLDTNLIIKLQEEIQKFITYEALQGITQYDLENNFLRADYYNIYDVQIPDSVSVWEVNFSDYQTFYFSFLIDTQTYRIYGARIFCEEADQYANQLLMSETEMLKLTDLFKERCLDYYEADSASIDASKPNIVVELVYEDFKAYPSRNLSVIDKSKVLGVGIDIGFINIWNALLK